MKQGSPKFKRILEVIAFFLAFYLGGLAIVNLQSTVVGPVVSVVFPHINKSVDVASINSAWDEIQKEYVIRSVDNSVGTLGAEQGIVDSLKSRYNDRFTALLTSREYNALQSDLSGQRSGSIGITVSGQCANEKPCASGASATEVVITEVLTGQPANKAGIKSNDVIMGVDDKPLSSMAKSVDEQLSQAAGLIRGAAGTTVKLTLRRGQDVINVKVTRANLNIPSVYSQLFGKTLYLQVTGFDTNTSDEAKIALQQGEAKGANSIVLDLRSDGGGYVTASQALVSQFVTPTGTQKDVVVRRGRLANANDPASAQSVTHDPIEPGGVALSPKLVVLVDGNTASAAEIVTAALHDYHRAKVVGQKTFGKGSVQIDYPLPDGNDLHITVEKWYSPDGTTIDGKGITPDISASLPASASRFRIDVEGSNNPNADPQLLQALNAVNN